MSDILPDKWREVAEHRRRKYDALMFKNLYPKKLMIEDCEKCPLLRIRMYEGPYDDFVFSYCPIYGNKCIKQYPHRKDNKEFK